MAKKNKVLLLIISIFVFLQAVLNIFLLLEEFKDWFSSDLSDCIKYVSVIACFVMSTISLTTKKGHFIILGLAFTLIADYFLLILDDYYIIGLSAFIFTQTMYFLYIQPKHWKVSLIFRFGLFGIMALLLPLALKITEVSAFLAAFYFINLATNAVDAYTSKDKGLLMLAIGLTFFIGCDIFVCIYNLKKYIDLPTDSIKAIKKIGFIGIWICYIPSQTLIAISPFFKDKYESISTKQYEE